LWARFERPAAPDALFMRAARAESFESSIRVSKTPVYAGAMPVLSLRRLRPTLLVAGALFSVPALQAAPVQLDCTYAQSADPEDGLHAPPEPLKFRFTIDRETNEATVQSGEFTADLEVRFSQRHVTLMQHTGNQGLYVTAIVFDAFDESDLYRSVHSRHAMIGSLGELRASQYYGRCEPVFVDEGSGGR
jgi:hypothetical protein